MLSKAGGSGVVEGNTRVISAHLTEHSKPQALLSDQALTDGNSLHALRWAAQDDHVDAVGRTGRYGGSSEKPTS